MGLKFTSRTSNFISLIRGSMHDICSWGFYLPLLLCYEQHFCIVCSLSSTRSLFFTQTSVTDGREFIFESCHPFSTRRRHFHSSFNMRRNVLFNFLLCLPAPGDQAKINSIFMQDKVLFSESKPGYCPLGFLRSYIFPYLNQWLRKDAYDNQSLQVLTLRIKYVVL